MSVETSKICLFEPACVYQIPVRALLGSVPTPTTVVADEGVDGHNRLTMSPSLPIDCKGGGDQALSILLQGVVRYVILAEQVIALGDVHGEGAGI